MCRGTKGRHPVTNDPLTYIRCPIHRIVKGGWFQTGDVIDGSGSNNVNIFDSSTLIPDESFTADFGYPLGGIVGLSNNGPHSNGSLFFITLGPCEWMNTKYVGIGRVLFGYKVLKQINNASTTYQRPDPEIVIKDCGTEI